MQDLRTGADQVALFRQLGGKPKGSSRLCPRKNAERTPGGELMPEQDHDRLIRIDERLARMESGIVKITDDHERRMRSLEKRQWINFGAIAASGTALGAVIKHAIYGGR